MDDLGKIKLMQFSKQNPLPVLGNFRRFYNFTKPCRAFLIDLEKKVLKRNNSKYLHLLKNMLTLENS